MLISDSSFHDIIDLINWLKGDLILVLEVSAD